MRGYGLLLKNSRTIKDASQILEYISKSKSHDENLNKYLEENHEILNIEYLEYHDKMPNIEDEESYKALIFSFKGEYSYRVTSTTYISDIDIEEISREIDLGRRC